MGVFSKEFVMQEITIFLRSSQADFARKQVGNTLEIPLPPLGRGNARAGLPGIFSKGGKYLP